MKIGFGLPRILKKDVDAIASLIDSAIIAKGSKCTSLLKPTHSKMDNKEISYVLAFPVPANPEKKIDNI